jgi:CRP/FNR family cyclic AMP-dependent transcriptional regulator
VNDRHASPGGLATTGSPCADAELIAELRSIGLFGALDDEQLEHLARTLPVAKHDAEAVVFREGDQGRAMYVILEGALVVTKNTVGGKTRHIAELGAGEWFGEMSLLDVMPRLVTVATTSPTRLLRVCPTDLDALYRRGGKSYALLVMNLARELSRKLRTATERLAENGDC